MYDIVRIRYVNAIHKIIIAIIVTFGILAINSNVEHIIRKILSIILPMMDMSSMVFINIDYYLSLNIFPL